jgi:hypothetical protein
MGKIVYPGAKGTASFSRPSALLSTHDVSRFDCGKAPLTDWLRERAFKAEGRSARTYVTCLDNDVVGYYCLATAGIGISDAPPKVRRNMPDPIPVGLIGRLAVHTSLQGTGARLGSGLLRDGIQRMAQAAEIVGMAAILVHAIDEDAMSFYMKYGFAAFPPDSRTFFLPRATVFKAIA